MDDLQITYLLVDLAIYCKWSALDVAQAARRWLVLRDKQSHPQIQAASDALKAAKGVYGA